MINQAHNPKTNGHGDYERRDIGVSGVIYFILGLVIAGVFIHFIVTGLFNYLNRREEAKQTPVSPLVKNAPEDTRRIPPQYGNDYEKYLKEGFPAPQLETDERTELNEIRLREENTLNSYGWIDQKAGSVHIPIDRAMDMLVQRGLPVRNQSAQSQPDTKKETNQ